MQKHEIVTYIKISGQKTLTNQPKLKHSLIMKYDKSYFIIGLSTFILPSTFSVIVKPKILAIKG